MTRDAWRDTAVGAGVRVVEVEVVCSEPAEHRRRVTSRSADVPGLPLPNWQQVVDREYEPWDRERVVVDTAGQSPQQSLDVLLRGLASG
ncbi:hypothetical protein [Streptomyces sp. NPDC017673]|uniref:hypothetical protein n=1 Tax=unclassified Streptomyces TaxID=2593676 RepID=UPI0037B03B25